MGTRFVEVAVVRWGGVGLLRLQRFDGVVSVRWGRWFVEAAAVRWGVSVRWGGFGSLRLRRVDGVVWVRWGGVGSLRLQWFDGVVWVRWRRRFVEAAVVRWGYGGSME